MNNVYVLTAGEYSGKSIVGIFSNKKLAEKMKEATDDANEIEEFPIDDVPSKVLMGYKYYTIYMDRNGNSKIYMQTPFSEYNKNQYYFTDDFNEEKTREIVFELWAKNEKQAIKMSNEYRAQIIANNLWIEEGWHGYVSLPTDETDTQ
jgi:hypothetical protein